MTDQGFGFCPRCGTALVEGMRYCGKCGFDVAALAGASGAGSARGEPAGGWSTDRGSDPTRPDRDPERRRSGNAPMLVAALIIAAGLVGYGLVSRPQAGGEVATPSGPTAASAGSLPPGTTHAPSAPIVGLHIETPRDGDVVSTQEVTVIGLAPPGLTITRDVSLRPDQHATVDSTGHWAIAVRLDQGENTLVFRIGDDRSTEQRLRVTFTPPA